MEAFVISPPRTGEQRLSDGRTLGWAEWGPEKGFPVLLSPGAATSRHLGFGAGILDDLGVRLISVDRPGLGASTAVPSRTFADFAADTQEFVERRELGKPAMVGNSQGAPFALACAAAEVVDALALTSAADEIAQPRFAEALGPQLRHLVDTVVFDPVAARRILSEFDAQTMWNMVISGSPSSDLAVYQDEAFAAAYRQALAEAFGRGPQGYACDTVLAMGYWSIDLASIRVPVDLWYGEQDTSHSPDLGVWLAERIPGCVRHVVPGIGGAVLWTHAEHILRRLVGR